MQKVRWLQTADELKALAHPARLHILNLLEKEELTNRQIAELMNQQPSKVHFHVQELLKNQFIALVRQEIKGGIVEKYYRATACSLVLSPDLYAISDDMNRSIVDSVLKTALDVYISASQYFNQRPPSTEIVQQSAHLTDESYQKIQDYFSKIKEELSKSSNQESKNTHEYMVTWISHIAKPDSLLSEEGGESHEPRID